MRDRTYWKLGVGAIGLSLVTSGYVSYVACVAGVCLLAIDFYGPRAKRRTATREDT